MLLNLVFIFETVSFLISLIIYFKPKIPTYLKYFPVFLLITVIVESIGLSLKDDGLTSRPMFNFFSTFEFVFYLFVLYHIIQNKTVKRAIIYCSMLYPVAAISYILSIDKYAFHSLTYTIGAIMLVCLCVFFFYEIFSRPVFNNLLREPAFWICVGLLLYYSCTIPLFVLIEYLRPEEAIEAKIWSIILGITNYMLYSSFSIAFICFYKFIGNTISLTKVKNL